jgi:hypothetical protein
MFTLNLMTNWSTGSKVGTGNMRACAHSHTHTHTPHHSTAQYSTVQYNNLKSLLFHFWDAK